MAATPAAPAPASVTDVYAALPGGEGVRLEAAAVVRDARGIHDAWRRHLAPLLKTEVGKAWEEAARRTEILGIRTYEEWERLVALASPDGGDVPLALAVFSRGEQMQVQALVKVAPGFVRRVADARAGGGGPFWSIAPTEQGLEITWGDQKAFGLVDQDGWLRISPARLGLVGPRGPGALFEGKLEEAVRKADIAVFLQGGGMLAQAVTQGMDPGPVGAALGGVRGLAVTFSLEESGTYALELLADAPLLRVFGPTIRKPDLANTLAKGWDAHATTLVSVSLPPPVLAAVGPSLRGALADSPVPPPEGLVAALTRLEGRLGLVAFGSPGDWGFGLEFVDRAAAAEAVRGLHAWAQAALAVRPSEGARTLRLKLEERQDEGPVLHISPDLAVEGVRMFPKGRTLMITGQAARHAILRRRGEGESTKGLLDGPLSPGVRATLAQPAMVLAYTVLSGDGRLFDLLSWVLKAAEIGAQSLPPGGVGGLAWDEGALHRAGATTVATGFLTMMFYDVALSADVRDGLLSLRVATSLL